MNKLILALLFLASTLSAQKRNSPIYNYIEKYGLKAINTMHETQIPASIIMAMAIEESAAGESLVARNSNNHFGMKANKNYEGATYQTPGKSLFKKYATVGDSYEAFGKLLVNNKSQYGFLFKYGRKDYKNWAKGIVESGYCQGDKTYSKRLINIIEEHELYNFDECLWEFK
jgi:flagellum-specific peptidoglycan hydrolase FlgJ